MILMLPALFAGCNKHAPADTAASPQTTDPAAETQTADNAGEPPGKVIKIRHIVDLTGNEALRGEKARRSLEFAIKNLGGVFASHPIEIVINDAKSATQDAVDAARQMGVGAPIVNYHDYPNSPQRMPIRHAQQGACKHVQPGRD